MKKIFVIDRILIVVFILSAFSGIELHIARHGSNHELWNNWAIFHVLTSVLFFISVVFHTTTHGGWYKGFIRNGIGKKSKITVGLSIIFLLVSVTGFVLLFVNGATSNTGLWHYRIGIITTALSGGHSLKRTSFLRKWLK